MITLSNHKSSCNTLLTIENNFSHYFSFITFLLLDDPSEVQREEFLFEIAMMKLLGAHQNIVSLVGCCTLQEHKFLVIEYVPFGDLLQWLRRKRSTVGNDDIYIFMYNAEDQIHSLYISTAALINEFHIFTTLPHFLSIVGTQNKK